MGLRGLPFSSRTIPFLLSHHCDLSFKHVLHQVSLYLPCPLSFSWSSSLAGFSFPGCRAAAALIAWDGRAVPFPWHLLLSPALLLFPVL